jgi:hypothetical protein
MFTKDEIEVCRTCDLPCSISAGCPLAHTWHTETPTEEGWYLIAIRFGNRIEYESRRCRRTIDNNGNECMRFDGCNPVIAWQKIEPYKGANNEC